MIQTYVKRKTGLKQSNSPSYMFTFFFTEATVILLFVMENKPKQNPLDRFNDLLNSHKQQ